MTRPTWSPARRCLWLCVALAIAGCGPSATQASPLVPSATPGPPSDSPAPIAPTASPPSAETRPPDATLVDAGGRGVAGQVGTFTWQGVVSDSPLLSGAAATVRTGQALSISTAGPPPSSWAATLFADPANPASGTPFGQGAGEIDLVAPDRAGAWTLRLKVVYPAGDVTHFWRLTVTD